MQTYLHDMTKNISPLLFLFFPLLMFGCASTPLAQTPVREQSAPMTETATPTSISNAASLPSEPSMPTAEESIEALSLSDELRASLIDYALTHLARDYQSAADAYRIFYVEGELPIDAPLSVGQPRILEGWDYQSGRYSVIPVDQLPATAGDPALSTESVDVVVLFGIVAWDSVGQTASLRLDRLAGPKAGNGFTYVIEWKPNSPIPWTVVSQEIAWIN